MVPVSGCFKEEGEEGEEGEGGEEEGGARSSPRRADIPRRARSLIVVPLLAAAGRECTGGRELGRPHVGQRFGVLARVQCTRKSTVFTHYMKNLGVCTFTRIVCFGRCTVVKLPDRQVRMFIVWPEQWVCRPL